MAKYVDWHGTIEESQALQRALNRHCACRLTDTGALERCGPHELLVEGQSSLNRLLFVRRIAHHLVRQELRLDPRGVIVAPSGGSAS